MYLNRHISLIKDKKIVLLINNNNGKICRLTTDAYEILNKFISSDMDINQFAKKYNDNEFEEYFKSLISNLTKIGVIYNEKDNENERIQIYWDITDVCNLACIHCCADANCKKDKELNIKYKQIIDKIAQIKNVDIVISGGEPLMCENFDEISSYLRKKINGKISLMTNATLIDEQMAEIIYKNYDSVSVSIDGYNEETTSIIRGKGVFDRTMKGIRMLQDNGVKDISASMLLTKKTINDKNKFSELCNKNNLKEMMRCLTKAGRAVNNLDKLEIETEWKNFKPENLEDEIENKKRNRRQKNGLCQATYSSFQIDKAGFIYPCQLLKYEEFIMENILEIDDTYSYFRKREFVNTPAYKEYSKYLPNNLLGCGDCKYTEFCHTCPAEEYLKNGNYVKGDCDLAKKIYEEHFR